MGNTWSRPNDVVPFVDASQEDIAEVNRPDAVVDLLEPDGVLLECVGDEQQALLQTDGAGVGDALDDEVPGTTGRAAGRRRTRVLRGGRATQEAGSRGPRGGAPHCRG